MKIVIENTKFDFDIGCGLLKLKHDECPYPELEDMWDDIKPLGFKDIAKFENIEERRVGIGCLGIDRLTKEINPKLIDSETIEKTTSWVDKDGNIVETKFDDTYELYEVERELLLGGRSWGNNFHYIKCKDTSTDREYLIWVDVNLVHQANGGKTWDFKLEKVNPIQCIAWTIQTDIPKGNIERLIRQGDCVLIEPKGEYEKLSKPRHLTEDEYIKLLVAES